MTGITASALSVPSHPHSRLVPLYRGAPQHARSIDSVFLSRLQKGRFQGSVHSVFNRVVNVQHDDGDLYTLASDDHDDAPNTAILKDITSFEAFNLAIGDPVGGDARQLRVGSDMVIALTDASAWNCVLPAYPQWPVTLLANLCRLRDDLCRLGVNGGMLASHAAAGAFNNAMTALLEQRVGLLSAALGRADFVGAARHAAAMIGLGPGLTPSGDDFLVGLFAVLNIPGSPCHGWLHGGRDVLVGTDRATNAISLTALTQAAAGRVRASIVALIEHLLYRPTEALAAPLRMVLAIGSTSGTDIVAGIRYGLELNISHGEMPSCQFKW